MVGRVALLALVLAAATARADDPAIATHLAAARTHRAALRYHEALVETEAALSLGGASPAQTAALYRLTAELAAGLDRPAIAEAWFARWLALEPTATLGDDASPKLTTALAAARFHTTPLRLTAQRRGDAIVVTVDTRDGLVRAVRVTAAPDAPGVDATPEQPVPWPRRAAAVVIALDEHGNHLAYATVAAVAASPSTPLYRRWQPYAGASLVVAAVGAGFAWRTGVAQDDFDALRTDGAAHPFADYEAVRARGERDARIANVALVGAGVLAVTAAIVWWQRPRATEVTVAPTATGAAVAISGRF